MLKKLLVLLTLICCSFNINAQEESTVKLGVETGFLPLSKDTENLGLFVNIEPKVKILKNTFLGLNIGLTINSHSFENSNPLQYLIDERFDNAIFSFMPTVDYYLKINNYHPFIGLGLGYHLHPNPIEIFSSVSTPSPENVIEGTVGKRIGFLLRGGVEIGRLRLGILYTLVPKGDIKLSNEEIIGTVANSYFGVSIGFMFFGNKKWATPSERSNPND